jgi:hypothetical protein
VDTYVGRRNTSRYRVVRHEGLELLVAPELADQARSLEIGLVRFLFWRRLDAQVEIPGGLAALERQ